MPSPEDLKKSSEAELAQALIDNVQACRAVSEYAGKHNRWYGLREKIFDELKARGAVRAELQRLLDHPDDDVRSTAAWGLHWLDSPRPEPPPPRPLPPQFLWQLDHAPPRAMTRDEIAERLRGALPDFWQALVDLALPAVGLWPQRSRTEISGTASRFGGTPWAPPDWQWPVIDDEPMIFIGQINCADLRNMPGAECLPTSGLLAFFAEYDGVMACRFEACDAAVYQWTGIERLVPAVAPIEPALILPPCAFVTRAQVDLPHPHSAAVGELGLNKEQSSRYAEVWKAVRSYGIPDDLDHYCSFSKLLGWPALVQMHDLDVFGAFAYEDTRLLLQVDQYCSGETERVNFGPGGSLYFTLPEQDLRQSNFGHCSFEIQFT